MYIKSIVLDGFKSYGQRTEISGFDPMFNAITGLNGSGKSNILDSICFVLGITNLSHLRANNMQDLIFKSGQAGINKATVSITFDNRDRSQWPPGFENVPEITITRQIAIGGKNKYLINGVTVTNKKINDLFCSVQLNVNNPHFLIMQGKITKVLNMKPAEILSMVEEAAGTRMYEHKRQATQKIIEKKDAKLQELETIMKEDAGPRLEKLRADREQYFEYQHVERLLENMMGIYQVWQYFEAKRNLNKAEEALETNNSKENALKEKIKENEEAAKQLDAEAEAITNSKASEAAKELEELQAKLKQEEKKEAEITASAKSTKSNIASEEKKKSQLKERLVNEEKTLKEKENELNKVQAFFETLKENDEKDSEALALSQKKYEALCAGMEVNDEGQAETLREQLMKAKADASTARTEIQQSTMQLNFCQDQLKEKRKEAIQDSSGNKADEANLKILEQQVNELAASLKKINFSEEGMNQLQQHRRTLYHEVRNLRENVENFETRRPFTSFRYRDPEPNFNRASVKGVVCKLMELKDPKYALALETAAGGKLYNVIVDTDITSKKLLQRGDLQTRTTFIPLNKITAYKMDNNVVKLAQNLVGAENCQPALSLINYDKSLAPAMEFIFGDVFICKDISVARKVTFHDRIKKRCVTLEGDSTNPSGTLSGGAPTKGECILKQLQDIRVLENELRTKEQQLRKLENDISHQAGAQEQYSAVKRKLDSSEHELNLIRQRLHNTSFHRIQEELSFLETRIEQLQTKIKSCCDTEKQSEARAKELEAKMEDSTGYRQKRLKEAEAEMKRMKLKADKSKEEWRQREEEYAILKLEIEAFRKSIDTGREELKVLDDTINKLKNALEEISAGLNQATERVQEVQTEVKRVKTDISEKNHEIQAKMKKKEKLLAQNNELELEIRKNAHEMKEMNDACKNSRFREQEYAKKISKSDKYMEKGKALTVQEGQNLGVEIKMAQERKHKLGRLVNTQAQSMFESQEKGFNDVVKRQKVIEKDKQKLLKVMVELDEKKKHALKLAYEQVSKDFGSIFGTLLPEANATLSPLPGKNILQGLEIKVSLGGVWKENLTELSGGQRSLAALSLILAMLLFKPAPLYILDEVDAALDMSHTQNIGQMLRSHFKKSQFIIVSLKDGMFSNANVLFRTKFMDGVSAVQRTARSR